MKANELLEAVKAREGITSNYRLAKVLDIPENRINDYAHGRAHPDEYAATKIALALELDPISVIAELKAESEKDEKKREFWRNFLTRAALVVASLAALHCGFPSNSEVAVMPGANDEATERQIIRSGRNRFRRLIRRLLFRLRAPECGALA